MGQRTKKGGDNEVERRQEKMKKKMLGVELSPIMAPYLSNGICSVSSGPANKHLITWYTELKGIQRSVNPS